MSKLKVFLTASTRPEIIKLAPVIRELESKKIDYIFAATGQHYSYELFKEFIEELGLREPDYNLEIGSGTNAEQTANALIGIEKLLEKEKPTVVITEGDTNSVLSTALASAKLRIPVAHVEAGLRSFDNTMPEEINRRLTDHCSEILFAPTEKSALNLINEGISPEKIFVVGNTIVDAVFQNLKIAEKRKLKLQEKLPKNFALLTLHRQENVDNEKRLKEILEALSGLKIKILFPVHPRTEKNIKRFGLNKYFNKSNFILTQPLGYLDFLFLLKKAFAVFTDSGGVQEEAIVVKTPCVTLRYNTERPETIEAGGNILAAEKSEIINAFKLLSSEKTRRKMKAAKNPFGDGKSGARIVKIIKELHRKNKLKVSSSDLRKGIPERKIITEKGEIK